MLTNDANRAASRRELADTLAIPLGVAAPAAARRFVADQVADTAPAVLDTALLLVSELVTNSVRHSSAARDANVVVRVRVQPGECWLEVEDPGQGGPIAPRMEDAHSGLLLVDFLSDQWGVARGPDGPTRVWARLATGRSAAGEVAKAPTAVVERIRAHVSPDPKADITLAEARSRARRGDASWSEWLDDIEAGRAIVALLEIEVTLSVDGAEQRLRARTPGVWLEREAHPPLVERQVQDVAAISLSTLSAAIGMRLGVPAHEVELASMNVHVELDAAIRARLRAPVG